MSYVPQAKWRYFVIVQVPLNRFTVLKLQWRNLDPTVIFLQQVRDNELPDCVEKSMYFCEHTSSERASKDHSKRNPDEAREITSVVKTFCEKGRVDPSRITVLCAYRGQASI